MNFIEELKWRGMLQDHTPDAEKSLAKGMQRAYIGFDPTAPSLTIGNMVQIMILAHFQNAGHQPVALIGGATGMIGDPSGKSEERKLLSKEELQENVNRVKEQLEKFLDFSEGKNKAILLNNFDWFGEMNVLEFLRDAGKHLTVNYMMAKDSVKSRLEAGISFTEFSYQLLQGYDFVHLFENHNCGFQMGGSDQWGNITTGIELIRRMKGGEAHGIVTPLLTKSDGSKFGKSESGNIWLDPERTSPFKFYQFWLNCADDEMENLVKYFSLKPIPEIKSLIKEHHDNPGRRVLQYALAGEMTERVHGTEALEKAKTASKILFGKSAREDLLNLSSREISEIFEGVPSGSVLRTEVESGKLNIVDMLAETGAVSSKSEARRFIDSGALRLNLEKVEDQDYTIDQNDLLNDELIVVKKGKKKFHIITVK